MNHDVLMTRRLALGLALTLAGTISRAQGTYPAPGKSPRLLVGTSAGGITDSAARKVAEKLSELLGTTFIVENKDGAAGIIAARTLTQAPRDGYTLLLGSTSSSILSPLTAETSPFAFTDLAPVGYVGGSPMTIYINPQVPAKSLDELVALLKRSPGKYSFASAGIGSTAHVTGELFQQRAGVELIHVPFRGGPGVDQAVVAGDVQIGFNAIGPVAQLDKSGRVRLLATFTQKRSELVKDTPTAKELGVDMTSNISFYVLAMKGTPAPVLAALNGAMAQALQSAQFRKDLLSHAIEPASPMDPKATLDVFMSEVNQWREVLRSTSTTRK